MNLIKESFKKILKNNDFLISEVDQTIQITKSKSTNSIITWYFNFAIFATVLGFISLLSFSILLGIVVLSSSIPLFMKVNNLKRLANFEGVTKVVISKESLIITNANKTTTTVDWNVNEYLIM